MAGFVFCHFVNRVVDGVIAQFLGFGGNCQLALAGTGFRHHSLVQVGLGVPDNLSEELGELGCVLCLLESVALEGIGNLRVSLALRLAAHCQVHSNLGAFSVEVVTQALHYFLVFYYSVLEVVLTGPAEAVVHYFNEFFFLCAALGTELRRVLSFIYVTANETSEFLFHNFGYLRVNIAIMCFTNIVYLCNMTRYFSVAGHGFFIKGEDSFPLWDAIDNYRPFQTGKEECLFGLEICTDWVEYDKKAVYFQNGADEEQRLDLYSVPEGWLVEMAPRRDMDICSKMFFSRDYSLGKVYMKGNLAQQRFALDNSAMVLFAFATASLGTLEMHASVVSNSGKAYLFLAKSGVGKSTHSRLWIENVPGTQLVNDDNPVLRVMEDGSVKVFGSPWSGKTPCYRNVSFPAGALVRINRAPENRIHRLPLVQAYASVAASCSGFRPEKSVADGLHATLSAVVSKVPCYILDCLPDAQAAIICSDNVRDN